MALLFVGIPLLILEFALGQTYQSGDVVAFGSIHRRLRGIGFSSVWEAFMVVVYYNVIIGWSLYYLIASFQSPMPWMANNGAKSTAYFLDVLNLGNPLDGFLTFQGEIYAAVLFTWVVIYLSIWKGVQVTGKVVYLTCTLPAVILVILVITGLTLEGSGDGIRAYIGNWDFDQLKKGDMWSRAVTQIFFSIGVTFGIMTAYASYNDRHARTVQDAVIVACSNSAFSFIAGFAVYSILGYMANEQGKAVQQVSRGGVMLAFTVYPVGLGLLGEGVGNFFCVLFFMTLFFLGVDSAFSMVEAVCTAIHDSRAYNHLSRELIAGAVCLLGVLLSTFYCTNIGLYLLDVVDYWINGIAMLFVGLMETVASGWVYGLQEQIEANGKPAVATTALTWFVSLLLFILAGHAKQLTWGVVGVIFTFLVAGLILSVVISQNPDKGQAFEQLMIGNVEALRNDLNAVVTANGGWKIPKIWGFCIKYVIPSILVTMLSLTFADRIESAYEGYPASYQAVGLIVALSSTMMIVIGLTFPGVFESWMPHETQKRIALGREDKGVELVKVSKEPDQERGGLIAPLTFFVLLLIILCMQTANSFPP